MIQCAITTTTTTSTLHRALCLQISSSKWSQLCLEGKYETVFEQSFEVLLMMSTTTMTMTTTSTTISTTTEALEDLLGDGKEETDGLEESADEEGGEEGARHLAPVSRSLRGDEKEVDDPEDSGHQVEERAIEEEEKEKKQKKPKGRGATFFRATFQKRAEEGGEAE